MSSVFTISLDFELHWGGFDKWDLSAGTQQTRGSRPYFLSTRRVIPEMLAMFAEYDVHVTWAAVGMLLHSTRTSLLDCAPRLEPSYRNPTLSAYEFIRRHGIGEDEESDPFHFGSSLVRNIIGTPGQELGTHTFGHYYCNEPGQTTQQFAADLQAAKRSVTLHNRTLRSLVFPRNQFNEGYLRICYEEGIVAVRDNPVDWFWRIQSTEHESMWKRLNRGLDAYIPVGSRNSYPLDSVEVKPGLPLRLPASRLLRPYRPGEWILNEWKIKRVKQEMEEAARQGEVYHLWWHPHNFAAYPAKSLAGLRQILDHFAFCMQTYGMTSLTMGETADRILKRHGIAAPA